MPQRIFFTKVVKSIFNGKGTDYHVNAVSIPSHEMPSTLYEHSPKVAAFPYGIPRKRIKTYFRFYKGEEAFSKNCCMSLLFMHRVHWFLGVVPLLSISERCLIAVIYWTETQRVTQAIYLRAHPFPLQNYGPTPTARERQLIWVSR